MNLTILSETLAICRLKPNQPIPEWVLQSNHSFLSITYTDEELSIVCALSSVPNDVKCEKPWKAIKIIGELDFGQIGILSSLITPLSECDVSVFAVSTFNTDYILVKECDISRAKQVLLNNKYTFA